MVSGRGLAILQQELTATQISIKQVEQQIKQQQTVIGNRLDAKLEGIAVALVLIRNRQLELLEANELALERSRQERAVDDDD